jgi:hypothetical protein
MDFVFHDGGRVAAGYRGKTGDCVTRSIAIATVKAYQEVYEALNRLAQTERMGKRKRRRSSSRTGVFRQTYQAYLESSVGSGPQPCRLVLVARFTCGLRSCREVR